MEVLAGGLLELLVLTENSVVAADILVGDMVSLKWCGLKRTGFERTEERDVLVEDVKADLSIITEDIAVDWEAY